MIRLHSHPLPPSPVRKLALLLRLPVCRRSSLLPGEGAGERGAWSQIIWPQESLGLYKSFNPLCSALRRKTQRMPLNTSAVLLYRESDTRFSTSGFFHKSVSPGPLSIPLGSFRIFLKIRGDFREWMLISGVNDTGERREKFWDKIFQTILLRA